MKCQEVQTGLYEQFGVAELPDEVMVHLAECDECRGIWAELQEAGSRFGNADGFALNDFEANRLLAAVNDGIDAAREQVHAGGAWPWIRWAIPVAAAIVLLLGIAFLGNEAGPDFVSVIDSMLLQDTDTAAETIEMALYDDMDAGTVDVLLEDYSTRPLAEPSGLLLEDLTDDEYEYLAKNFDVGELL